MIYDRDSYFHISTFIFRLHRMHAMHEMQPIVTDDRGVCQSVCLSRGSIRLHCAKTGPTGHCVTRRSLTPQIGEGTYF